MNIKGVILAILLLAILTIGTASAADDNVTSDNLAVCEDLDMESSIEEDILTTGEGTFYDLSALVNSTSEYGTLELDKDYKNDGSISERIKISKAMTIDGKGHTVDADFKSGMFQFDANMITLKNVRIVNANFQTISGSNCNIINCSFENCANNVEETVYGGVLSISDGDVINCSFVNCSNNCNLVYGGAISFSSSRIINSTFSDCGNDCDTVYGGAINGDGSVINCNFSNSRIGSLYFSYVQFVGASNLTNCIFTDCWTGVCCNYGCIANITNCTFLGCTNGAIGFWCEGGNVTRCTFTGCCATAIYIHDSFVNVVDCIFRNCHSGDEGGAINIVERDDNVIDCIFINCSAAYKGGAIYVEDFDNNIINCSFINCSSENGGSVYWNGKNGTLNNSKFENSLASQNGGSVYWGGAKGNIENSTFINSRAKNGGAVYIEGKNNVSIYKSKFEKNYADALGGAVYGGNISDCDFSENSLPDVFDSSQNRSETIMEISINPNDAKVGNQISIIPNVMDNNRKTINGTVDLYLESTFIARVNSGEKYVYTANQTGFFEVTAEFTGNENYLESQSSEYFWVDESSSESTGDYDISDIVPDELITMDDGVVILEFPEDATGTVEVFINGNLEIVVEVVDGIARIDLSKYKDNFEFTFKYSGDDVYAGFTKELEVTVNVMVSIILADNLNMLYSSNGKYSIKAYDGDDNLVDGVEITFLINNKIYKTATTKNGVASIVISKAPGSYKITSQFLSVKVTKALKVKHILTLKKVAVKKSAKKLVLQATLSKVNKKYLKGKKITFKFNGKKYTAKTNKKGVAKLTIKSSVLKKLKVGKKITYQATYLKDTVKNKVKVKK